MTSTRDEIIILLINQLIFKQFMSFKNTRRLTKSISPMGDRSITPNGNSKYTNNDTTGQSNIHGPMFKQFSQSPATSTYYNRPRPSTRDEEFAYCTLPQINLQLDNNMNQIIFLLGRRKALTEVKKKKIRQQLQEKLERAKQANINNFQYFEDEQFKKVVSFCPNVQIAVKILGKVIRLLPQLRGPRADEEQKSQSFWAKNRQLQNQIDAMLQKMKAIDKNLQKQNHDVNQICKTLDTIQDNLKSIAGINKCQQNLQRVEPLFKSKKKNYDALNGKVKERQRIKDVKVEYIKRIKDALGHLKLIRENRLHQITQFFGLENVWDIQKYNFKDAGDFSLGFEELLKLRQRQGYLELSQREVLQQLDSLTNEQEAIYNELLRKQSDEAKAYHNYSKVMNQKIKYTSILSVFGDQQSHHQILSLNPNEISKKFKDYKSFLKRFMEQDSLIKQGLIKTNQTSQTFATVLKAIENEKERRQELLNLLENCIRKRGDYQHKKQDFRNLMVQITKNQQEHTHHQQELQAILSDGDIDSYKRIGNSIAKCENEKGRLLNLKQKLERDMDTMDKEVVGMANRIQADYQDILCEIVPADYEYSLKNSDDVKKLRNHLRKMYKRLGILSVQ